MAGPLTTRRRSVRQGSAKGGIVRSTTIPLAVLVSAASAAAIASGSDSEARTSALRLVAAGMKETTAANAPGTPSVGDVTFSNATLVDAADDKRTRGTLHGECRVGNDDAGTSLCDVV